MLGQAHIQFCLQNPVLINELIAQVWLDFKDYTEKTLRSVYEC